MKTAKEIYVDNRVRTVMECSVGRTGQYRSINSLLKNDLMRYGDTFLAFLELNADGDPDPDPELGSTITSLSSSPGRPHQLDPRPEIRMRQTTLQLTPLMLRQSRDQR